MPLEPTDELTIGQKLVGIKFNPSELEKVTKIKQHFADIIDILVEDSQVEPKLQEMFTDLAVSQAIIAQMAAVKAVTWGLSGSKPASTSIPVTDAPAEANPPAPAEPTPAPAPPAPDAPIVESGATGVTPPPAEQPVAPAPNIIQ